MTRKQTVNKIYEQLLGALLSDLGDPDKCTPGLYQVIRGVIQDNKDLLDSLPSDTQSLEDRLANSVPFKFKSATNP